MEQEAAVLAKAVEKYGVRGKKELAILKEALQKLPVEENTAIRYLLDPHLGVALLFPAEKGEDVYNKLEIAKYNDLVTQEDV